MPLKRIFKRSYPIALLEGYYHCLRRRRRPPRPLQPPKFLLGDERRGSYLDADNQCFFQLGFSLWSTF